MGEEKSIIKDRHVEELRTWLNTQEAADKLGLSRQGVINLARDDRSGVRAIHLGKHSEGERGYWIFDPYSIEDVLNARIGAEERARAEAERRKREETQRRIDRAEGRS